MAEGGKSGEELDEWRKFDKRKDFIKWFWQGTNGNILIKHLNNHRGHGNDFIRREKDRPTIYGIVLNDHENPFKLDEQWRLCKVGITHVPTGQDTNNRMEQVMQRIKTKYSRKHARAAATAVLFVLAIGAVDTTAFSTTEDRIRKKVGQPVKKDKAKAYGLPVSTEWVLTTQEHLNTIKTKIRSEKEEGNVIDCDIFKDVKDPPKLADAALKEEWIGK